MSQIECPSCHQAVESGRIRCPHCGYLAGLSMEAYFIIIMFGGAGLVALILILLTVFVGI
jgi:hypothetical protein